VSRFHRLAAEASRLLDVYQMGEAGRQMYDFMWGEFCDWYIEMTKVRLQGDDQAAADDARRVLVYVLDGTLKMLHPYMPFVTEAIWQYLPHVGDALIVAPWPQAGAQDAEAELRVSELMVLVRASATPRKRARREPGGASPPSCTLWRRRRRNSWRPRPGW
jgi:valyl-tRNA synthetase